MATLHETDFHPSLKPLLEVALAESREDALARFDQEKPISLTMDESPGLCPVCLADVWRSGWYPAPDGMRDA